MGTIDSKKFDAGDERGLAAESIGILTDRVEAFHLIVTEIREWAELYGMEDLCVGAEQAEDRVMLALHRQIPRHRNHVLDRLVKAWVRERKRLGFGKKILGTLAEYAAEVKKRIPEHSYVDYEWLIEFEYRRGRSVEAGAMTVCVLLALLSDNPVEMLRRLDTPEVRNNRPGDCGGTTC